jgi:Rrf2 family nitric oxide-sensitive transcriptional repressor
MRLTSYTDYALRVLMFLALEKDRLVTIREIAESYNISKSHLMKIVNELTTKGYLEAIRGKNGGLRLRCRPEQINLGVLVRETEPDFELVECFSRDNQCKITPACSLRSVLNRALGKFLVELDQYSLQDLLPQSQKTQLLRLLASPP